MEIETFLAPLVMLENARAEEAAARLFWRPRAVLRANTPAEVPSLLASAEEALSSGYHLAGYFAYELGYLLERRLEEFCWSDRPVPLAWLGVFKQCEIIDSAKSGTLPLPSGRAHAGPLEFEWNARDYDVRFKRLHDLIVAGDLYQANLTFRARFGFVGDPRALYRALKVHAGADYCAYIDDGTRQILSLSPELFFEISSDGVVRTKPMKGTAARGTDAAEDMRNRTHLLASEKERAENLMIVDLMRNDLSRICEVGSVAVERLFEVQTYPTLHQLVSTVAGRARRGTRVGDVVRALFPCGSVTGAPKIQAMQVIRRLEQSPRGVYCGAIGAIAPDGSAQFNVAIRTLTISGGRGELGIGGGVVFDSRSTLEYEESILKARYFEAARVPLRLIETLRWSPGEGFVRGERHLSRMARSATAFGIAFDRGWALSHLRRAVEGSHGPLRVRLRLDESGAFDADAEPFAPGRDVRWRISISPHRVQSSDALLRHKTSRRELFEDALARERHDRDVDEVLFVNERSEITEGSRTNLFVSLDGRFLTPALGCGLLDGCLRSELIERGRCSEAVVAQEDLPRANAIFVGNSLRGLIPATYVGSAPA